MAGSDQEWQGVTRSGRQWQGVAGSGREWQGVAGSDREINESPRKAGHSDYYLLFGFLFVSVCTQCPPHIMVGNT